MPALLLLRRNLTFEWFRGTFTVLTLHRCIQIHCDASTRPCPSGPTRLLHIISCAATIIGPSLWPSFTEHRGLACFGADTRKHGRTNEFSMYLVRRASRTQTFPQVWANLGDCEYPISSTSINSASNPALRRLTLRSDSSISPQLVHKDSFFYHFEYQTCGAVTLESGRGSMASEAELEA